MKAFFTGHRETFLKSEKGIKQLIDLAIERGTDHFYCGMALGNDQLFAQILIEKFQHWTAVIPCANQEKFWKEHEKRKYRKLLLGASKKVTLFSEYSEGVYHARNEYMIKRSDLCLAVYDGRKSGGTYETLKKALGRMNVAIFNPIEDKMTFRSAPNQLLLF